MNVVKKYRQRANERREMSMNMKFIMYVVQRNKLLRTPLSIIIEHALSLTQLYFIGHQTFGKKKKERCYPFSK